MAKSANSLEKTQEAMSEGVSGTRRGCCVGGRVGKERVRCRVVPVADCVGRWRGRWRRCWAGISGWSVGGGVGWRPGAGDSERVDVGKERVRCRVVPVADCVGRWRGRRRGADFVFTTAGRRWWGGGMTFAALPMKSWLFYRSWSQE